MKNLVSILALSALAGCASLHQSLEADITKPWSGASVDELIARWGVPSDDRSIADRRVLAWPDEYHCHRMAVIDGNTVVSASITGEFCPVMKLDPGSAYYLWRRT